MKPKRWWQSKTVLGALAALIATGVRALAPEADVAEGEILSILTQVAQTAGMIVAIIGRFKAAAPVITRGEAHNLAVAEAEGKLCDEWLPRGAVIRVGIAKEEIKTGQPVSIDAAGAVKVFRQEPPPWEAIHGKPDRGPAGETRPPVKGPRPGDTLSP